jgi:hypothetical protein
LIEKHPSASFHPVFATFGNAENTYTHKSVPERIDYLMYRAKSHLDMKVLHLEQVLLSKFPPLV